MLNRVTHTVENAKGECESNVVASTRRFGRHGESKSTRKLTKSIHMDTIALSLLHLAKQLLRAFT
jgi:hypothetical protein